MTPILKSILETLAYYDLFDFPLTAQEIFLLRPSRANRDGRHDVLAPVFEEVVRELDASKAAGVLSLKNGFYFLPGREMIVRARTERYDLAEKKYQRALAFFRLARFAPFLRAVFVCNTLGRSNARAGSDIDLFIVTAPGRVWLTRLMVAGLAALLRVRPTAEEAKDKLCLSFFVTADALNLQSLALNGDVYLAHWLRDLYPIYDEAEIGRRLPEENRWFPPAGIDGIIRLPAARRDLSASGLWLKKGTERIVNRLAGDRLEAWAKRLQLAWMPEKLKRLAAAGSAVVLSDAVLKFHDADRREEIRKKYESKVYELLHLARSADPADHRAPALAGALH